MNTNTKLLEYLDSALKATDIPDHKLHDTEFLRACCSIAYQFIKAAMEEVK